MFNDEIKRSHDYLELGEGTNYLVDDILTDFVFESLVLITSLLCRRLRPLREQRVWNKTQN
jgi:hypothetical protein